MKHTTIAVDLAKSVFEIAVSRQAGRVSERHRLSRGTFLEFFATHRPATVLMEACGSAHHWARQIQGLGHRVVLLPPHRTRPYVTGNKTDRSDAKGLLEAYRNEQIRAVPVKSIDQQTVSALHRMRSAWLAARTARINTVRGLLREFGIAIALGSKRVVPRLQELLEDAESGLPDAIRPTLDEARSEILELERRMRLIENQLRALSRQLPVVGRSRPGQSIGSPRAISILARSRHRLHNERPQIQLQSAPLAVTVAKEEALRGESRYDVRCTREKTMKSGVCPKCKSGNVVASTTRVLQRFAADGPTWYGPGRITIEA